jgi:NAD(P)-dependent dehydrogenase (short-subunit alcohol dehydrogenase family)
MSGRLAGKIAIVTGAASGQGAAAARIFASEGAQVAAFDINAEGLEALAKDVGDAVMPVTCDLTNAEAVKAGVASAVDRFGPVTVLCNYAGVSIRRPGAWDETQDGPTADVTPELFDKLLSINLKSVYHTCKYTIPHMIEAGGGSIINVASVAGTFVGANNHAYCASKGGVMGLTLGLAFTYGPEGIRANAICPGLVATPLVDHLLANEQYMATFSSSVPLRRIAQPEETAAAALFLASDDSSYVNGSIIPVDGGAIVRAPG